MQGHFLSGSVWFAQHTARHDLCPPGAPPPMFFVFFFGEKGAIVTAFGPVARKQGGKACPFAKHRLSFQAPHEYARPRAPQAGA